MMDYNLLESADRYSNGQNVHLMANLKAGYVMAYELHKDSDTPLSAAMLTLAERHLRSAITKTKLENIP